MGKLRSGFIILFEKTTLCLKVHQSVLIILFAIIPCQSNEN